MRSSPICCERSVLVVVSLHRQYRARIDGDLPLDVPGAETRIQPDVVPAPERRVDVGVVPPEPRAGRCRDRRARRSMLATLTSSTKTCGATATSRRRWKARRVQQRDRAAVAVTEQPGPRSMPRLEEGRQHLVGLPVQEVDVPALAARAVSSGRSRARVDQAAQPLAAQSGSREVLPHRERAQAFVEEDDERRVGALGRDPRVFDADARPASRMAANPDSALTPAAPARAGGSAGSCRSRSSAARRRTRSSAGTCTARGVP